MYLKGLRTHSGCDQDVLLVAFGKSFEGFSHPWKFILDTN